MALRKPRNLLLLAALLLAGILAAIVAVRYRPAADIADVVKVLPTGIDLALQQINYTHSEGGRPRWHLVAARVEHHAAEQLTALKDLQLTYFADDGSEKGTLTARTGQVNADFSVIEVQEDVQVVSHNGYRLQTDRLTYRQADRSVSSNAPVTLTGDGVHLEGVGLRLDLETGRLHILSEVHAVLQPKRSQGKAS